MHDVMIDLETMGTGPRAAIVAIGAVEFDPDTGTVGERFYQAVDLATSVSMGGEMDASTVLWWMQQGDEARAAFAKGGAHLSKALMDFSMWLHGRGTTDNLRMWGNGAAFDNVILASAYRAAMQVQPWRHWNDRCYRTIKAQHPGVKMERTGVHHNAADDAESQARHLVAMLKGPNVAVTCPPRAGATGAKMNTTNDASHGAVAGQVDCQVRPAVTLPGGR